MNLLSRERTVAGPGFNRWLVPPAALAMHLCIGMVYGLSVFWLPLSQAIGITHPQSCPSHSLGFILFARDCDWSLNDLKPIFTLGDPHLGRLGGNLGRLAGTRRPPQGGPGGRHLLARRPRHDRPGGLPAPALLMWLGGGVIGGIGLGLGYISPVSTLIKWFPDRRGMATGHGHHGLRRRRHDRRPFGATCSWRVPRPQPASASGKPCSPWPPCMPCSKPPARSATAFRQTHPWPSPAKARRALGPRAGTRTKPRNSGCSGPCCA